MQNLKDSTSQKHKIGEHRLSRYYAYHQLFLGVSHCAATGNALIPFASLLCLLGFHFPPMLLYLSLVLFLLENCSIYLKY